MRKYKLLSGKYADIDGKIHRVGDIVITSVNLIEAFPNMWELVSTPVVVESEVRTETPPPPPPKSGEENDEGSGSFINYVGEDMTKKFGKAVKNKLFVTYVEKEGYRVFDPLEDGGGLINDEPVKQSEVDQIIADYTSL